MSLSIPAIATLFLSLRNRGKEFIDKRFTGRQFDAQQVLVEFTATCTDETDL